MKMQRRRKRGGWGRNREKKKMGWRRKREERRDRWEERDGERWGFEGAVVGGGWKERRAGRVGNKREVAGTPPSCSVAGTSGLLLADR